MGRAERGVAGGLRQGRAGVCVSLLGSSGQEGRFGLRWTQVCSQLRKEVHGGMGYTTARQPGGSEGPITVRRGGGAAELSGGWRDLEERSKQQQGLLDVATSPCPQRVPPSQKNPF